MSKLVNYFSSETRLNLNIDRKGERATVSATHNSEYSERIPVDLFTLKENSNGKWVITILDENVIIQGKEETKVQE